MKRLQSTDTSPGTAPALGAIGGVLAVLNPAIAVADDWSGFPTLVLGLALVPGSLAAMLLVVLALSKILSGALYLLATAVFLIVAWFGFRIFAGLSELAIEGHNATYFVAIALLAICTTAYGVIAFRYWSRHVTFGSTKP